MEINDIWKNIEFENTPEVDLKKSGIELPLEKIKKSVRYNLIFAFFILLVYVFLIVFIPDYIIKAGVAILMAFSAKLTWDTWVFYKKINPNIKPENNLLNELMYQYEMIKKWIQVQERMGVFMYPISVAFGFLMGATAGSGLTIFELILKPVIVYSLIGSVAILTPVCYYLVRWMNNFIFKKDLETLGQIISNLKNE